MQRVSYVIVFASDMKRSVAFYRDVLELQLRFESPKWSEFATEGTVLALHAAAHTHYDPPGMRSMPAGHCHPGFEVDDIEAFHRRMEEHNVFCLCEPAMQEFGAKLAVYADPDGLPISVSERHQR